MIKNKYQRDYYEKNREKIIARQKQWYKKNKKRIAVKVKINYELNKEYYRTYYENNKDYWKIYYQTHKEYNNITKKETELDFESIIKKINNEWKEL